MIKKNLFLFLFFIQSNLASAGELNTQKRPHGKSPEAICGKLSFDLKERSHIFSQLKNAKDKKDKIFLQKEIEKNSKKITQNLTERITLSIYYENIEDEDKARKELLLFQTQLIEHDLFQKLIENFDILDHEQRESTVRLFSALKNFTTKKFIKPSGIQRVEEKLLQFLKEKTIPKYQLLEILTSLITIETNLTKLKIFLDTLLVFSQNADATISFNSLRCLEEVFTSPLIKKQFSPSEKEDLKQNRNYLWFLQFIKRMFSSDKRNVIAMKNYINFFTSFLTLKSNQIFLLKYTGDEHDFLRFLELFEEKILKLKGEAYYIIALFLINPREDRSAELVTLIKENQERIRKALQNYIDAIEKTKGDSEKKEEIIKEVREIYNKMLENLGKPCKDPKEVSLDHLQAQEASH